MLVESDHISISNPLDKENDVWAVCHLTNKKDARNQCILTRNKLLITRRGRDHNFLVETVDTVSTGRRKLLLPIITGGILTPLALLAIFNNYLSTNLTLPTFFAGLFLLYYGFSGAATIIITTNGNEKYVFINAISENLLKFITFSNALIKGFNENGGDFFFYALATDSKHLLLRDIIENLNTANKETGIGLFLKDALKETYRNSSTIGTMVLTIAPRKLNNPIELKTSSGEKNQFTVRSLNKESVVSSDPLNELV